MRAGSILCGLVLLLAVAPIQGAEAVVTFVDGRTLHVASVSVNGDVATLVLQGGSELHVPATRVARYQMSATAVAVAPPVRQKPNDAWTRMAGPYAETIRRAAQRHGVDPVLLTAMAAVESGFDPRAVSHKGAEGLLQLMPETAKRFGVADSFDPDQNIDGGARYLDWLLDRFSGDEQLALAGYNAGEAAVDRYQGVPPYPETEQYVVKVLGRADALRAAQNSAR
ncbi:MAG: transglycosylase SLT domain-containing protein [Acidobacteria bacterium]|nr:transglycosylase SLT domain-containing protein [Acidobacteriota bacterium]NIM62142.1 transglycosylase SLT domain-containing protein [Acidobacteriota bacterium]NIO59796.1 transglycosylase SLT domain-containing protein [Acidobacteriota bacterium]NIQ30879.1 transglycosylase SLT domain-containing protein [Acidobacteriota bacterium]NIQ85952.1 transglycosylase SLT domain-containing protein [Acidobacteriota bacterium]